MAEDPNVTLTIRLIMQGKEVGSIIGKKGEIVKKFREESGARINISDGSSPERIVTITGNTSGIIKAFDLICRKLEEVYVSQTMSKSDNIPKPPITLRLIVPASQCGSLIGKGGSKIREIREVTGASIQVASEMLPNSTERAVTISGMSDAITKCIYHICVIMLESPPKGGTIPYRPRPGPTGPNMMMGPNTTSGYGMQGNYALNPAEQMGKLGGSPLAGLAALGLSGMGGGPAAGPVNPAAPLAALAALAGSQLRTGANRQQPQQQTNHVQQEMTVPNELIGCVIGKGGTKIAEIRQISGAMIRISNSEELREGCTDRVISITGNPDSVALAQYLINMSVELQKANLESQKVEGGSPNGGGGVGVVGGSGGNIPPLAKLLSNPILSHLGSLGNLGGLNELLSAANLPHQPQQHAIQTTGVHRRPATSFLPKLKQSGSPPPNKPKNDRKFTPY